MATVTGNQVNLATALAPGTGPTATIAARFPGLAGAGPALVKILTAVGATPTATYTFEGSADGINWWSLLYADSATPATIVTAATSATTSATTRQFLISANQPYNFLRVNVITNTNVTNTIDVFFVQG